jgi:neutral ceramidase
MNPLLAGAARTNITPPLGVAIEGSFSPVFADHILDELYANALVLNDGDGTSEIAWVAVDVCQLPTVLYNEIAAEVERACGIPKARLFVTSSHTHSSATVGNVVMGHEWVDWAYVAYLKKQVVTAILMAQRNKQPAVLGAARAHNARHVFNRRLRKPEGGIIMNWFNQTALQGCLPAGPVDPELHVLKIAHPETKQPLAFIVNYPLHNNAASAIKTAISADFSGVMAEALRRVYGPYVVTLFLPGAMGDINWIDPHTTHERSTLYREIGLSLAGTVMQADYDMAYVDAPRLELRQTVLRIPEREWDANALSDKDVFQLEENEESIKRSPFHQAYVAWQAQGAPPLQIFDVDMRVLVLSDHIAIATNPSEFFVELGLAVKAQSPFKHTLVSTLTNGNAGYVPTRQAFMDGGYEVKKYPENSFLDVSAGEQMVAASVGLLGQTIGK